MHTTPAEGKNMVLFRILSRLLNYPDENFFNNLPEIQALVATDRSLGRHERRALQIFLESLYGRSLEQIQESYTRTFEQNNDRSLHLTRRGRNAKDGEGKALIELMEYHCGSVDVSGNRRELPDYLPIILEYVSTRDPLEGRWFLGQITSAITLIGDSLETVRSPYTGLIRLIQAHAELMSPSQERTA